MHLIFIVLVASIITCQAEKEAEVSKSKTPESLDVAKNFRQALLEALDQLENDEKNVTIHENENENDDLDASDFDNVGRTKFGHKIRDKISKQEAVVTSFSDADKASVFVHSFSTDDSNNNKSRESKNVHDKSNTHETTTVKFRTKLSSDNAISASATSTIAGNNHFLSNPTKTQSTAPVTPKTSLTSPNPTVSTPVEEEDETKAKVEDVQFIHAPLVAAFTVEQDDKGLPRKVIPIFGNKPGQNHNQFLNQNLQSSLEEKQRLIEQQIRILQEQRRQHELLLQQQTFQRQQQNNIKSHNFQSGTLLSDQKANLNVQNDINLFHPQDLRQRQISDEQNRIHIPIPQQKEVKSLTPRPTKDVSGTVVAFQPSIVFQPNGFNRGLNQNPSNQFNQGANQNPSSQLNQNFNQNSLTQFKQNFNQNPTTQFSQNPSFNQGITQNKPSSQFSQSLPQNPSSPSVEFSQSISLTPSSQFNQNQFKPSLTQNPTTHFTQSLPQNSAAQFNKNPSTQFNQNSATQFNQGLSQHSATQFNQGVTQNSATNFNQGLSQNSATHFNPGLNQNSATQLNQGLPQNSANQFNQELSQNSLQFNQLQFNQYQGLPVKSAIDFQKSVTLPISEPLNYVNQQIPNQFRDNIYNNDNYLQDFYYRQRTLVPPPRSNRVFRQETQVGNFGVNDFNQNQFNQRFNPVNYKFNNEQQFKHNNQFVSDQRNNFNFNNRQVQNQFFNNNNSFKQSSVDNRLKNLIYQSGLGQGRTQEDLNIVSKVLALDHTGNYQQNFLFGESNISEKRIPFNRLNKSFKT